MGNHASNQNGHGSNGLGTPAAVPPPREEELRRALFEYKDGTFRQSNAPNAPLYRHAPRVVFVGHPLLNMERMVASLIIESAHGVFTRSDGVDAGSNLSRCQSAIERLWREIHHKLTSPERNNAFDASHYIDPAKLAEVILANGAQRIEQLSARLFLGDHGAHVNDNLVYTALLDTSITRRLASEKIAKTRALNRADDEYEDDDGAEGHPNHDDDGADHLSMLEIDGGRVSNATSSWPSAMRVPISDADIASTRLFNINPSTMDGLPQIECFFSDYEQDMRTLGPEHAMDCRIRPALRSAIGAQHRIEQLLTRDLYSEDNTLWVFVTLSFDYVQWCLVVLTEYMARIGGAAIAEGVLATIVHQLTTFVSRGQLHLQQMLQREDLRGGRYRHAVVMHFDEVPALQFQSLDMFSTGFPSTLMAPFHRNYDDMMRWIIEEKLLQMSRAHRRLSDTGAPDGTPDPLDVTVATHSMTRATPNHCLVTLRNGGTWTFGTVCEAPELLPPTTQVSLVGYVCDKRARLADQFQETFGICVDNGVYFRIVKPQMSVMNRVRCGPPAAAAAATATAAVRTELFVSNYGTAPPAAAVQRHHHRQNSTGPLVTVALDNEGAVSADTENRDRQDDSASLSLHHAISELFVADSH